MSATQSGRIGVVGDPVEHSLSPAFQQAAFDALGIPVRYELLPTPADTLPNRIEELRSGAFTGCNVTVPHKEAFYAAVDERSDVATRAGAVNTVLCRDGQLIGDNTDVYGFVQSLRDEGFAFNGKRALILGAGGASRGVAVGLLDNDVQEVIIANRSADRARQLAHDLGDLRLAPMALADAATAADGIDLIINATAVGWQGDDLPVDRSAFVRLAPGAIAYDLTYRDTPFLVAARESGRKTIDGLAMLVHQGARSFELWTGHDAPFDVMWSAAVAAVQERDAAQSDDP